YARLYRDAKFGRNRLAFTSALPSCTIPLMRDLVQRYLAKGISRRGFVGRMTALGFTAAAAQAVLEPLQALEEEAAGKVEGGTGSTTVHGTGGELCVAQAKAAGVEYLFTNPGSFEVGFFDAF